MTKTALKVNNVTKNFVIEGSSSFFSWKKKQFSAVKDADFSVKQGEIFGILGHNGSGKSTLIRMIATLLIPDKGYIKVFGKDVYKNRTAVKKLINRVSVEASFFKRLSARENLMYAARLYGMDIKEAEEKAQKILKEIGFPLKKYDQSVEKFSRGLQQKIAITRGFLTTPKLLLLDEPTTGLDPKSKIEVQRFINKIRTKFGVTIIICSHDMNEIEELCDRLLIMNRGCIVAEGTCDGLKKLLQDTQKFEIVSKNRSEVYNCLKDLDEIEKIDVTQDKVTFESRSNILPKAVQRLKGIEFEQINTVRPTLEDVFLHLTGSVFGDEEE